MADNFNISNPTFTDVELKNLQALVKLMVKEQLDTVALPDGTMIVKKVHLGPKLPTKRQAEDPIIIGGSVLSDEDIMFASTAAPKRNLEDFDKFAANSPKDNK